MQNDLFLTAIVEYSVGEQSNSNAWGTLVSAVISECGANAAEEDAKSFLRTQEKIYKDANPDVSNMPAAYRSAKSVLLKALRYEITLSSDVGKSAMEAHIKSAIPESEPESAYIVAIKHVDKINKLVPVMLPEELASLRHQLLTIGE